MSSQISAGIFSNTVSVSLEEIQSMNLAAYSRQKFEVRVSAAEMLPILSRFKYLDK